MITTHQWHWQCHITQKNLKVKSFNPRSTTRPVCSFCTRYLTVYVDHFWYVYIVCQRQTTWENQEGVAWALDHDWVRTCQFYDINTWIYCKQKDGWTEPSQSQDDGTFELADILYQANSKKKRKNNGTKRSYFTHMNQAEISYLFAIFQK